MQMIDYTYLFPFEKVPKGSKILIYGAGLVGQEYLKQMLITNYCEVVVMVDRNADHFEKLKVPVTRPENISNYEIEYAVVALRSPVWSNEIIRILIEKGIPRDRIVYEERRLATSVFCGRIEEHKCLSGLAYENGDISIALYITGGFGDRIINKRFVDELIKLSPDCKIDIYTSSSEDYMKTIYYGCKNINTIKNNGAGLFYLYYMKYDIALSLQASLFIQMDHISELLLEKDGKLFDTMRKIKEKR